MASRIEDVLPLSSLQQGMLFHALFDETAVDVYTVQTAIELTGTLDATRLRAAADHVIGRHPNLRAAFVHDSGEPMAVVLREVTAPWEERDLTGADPAEIDALLAADRRTRFDMQAPPLMRFMLLRTGPDVHRLVLTHHHILLDGWSVPMVVREIIARYAGEALPPVRPFKDHLARLKTLDPAAGEAAWAAALEDPPEPTRIAPPEASLTAALPVKVPVTVPGSVNAFAQAHGLTPNTVLQGAWGLTLATALGRDDVLFGSVVSGRPADLPGVADMVGLFVNTVPVRVRVRPDETVAAFLTRLQAEQAALMDHQHVGLADIQRVAGVGELFDTLYVFESYPVDVDAIGDAEQAAELRVSDVTGVDSTNFPLGLTAGPGPDGDLVLFLEVRPDVVGEAAAQAWAARFARVVEAFVADADAAIGSLDLLTTGEHALVARWSTRPPQPLDAETVVDTFRRRVARNPDGLAVVASDETLTLAELDLRARRLAYALVEAGAGPDRTVAFTATRSAATFVAMLGIWYSGAAYLPLNPLHPAERTRTILDDAAPVALVEPVRGNGRQGDHYRARPVPEPGPDAPALDEPIAVDPRNAAYVIYTSGTTGVPKGVVATHGGLANLLAAHLHEPLGHIPLGRALSTASFTFDGAIDPLLWMLVGHELHVATDDEVADPDLLVARIRDARIDFIDLVPVHMAQVVESGLFAGGHHRPGVVTVGAEAVGATLWQQLAEQPGLVAYNCYGPTEYTVDATCALISDGTVPTIGRPMAATTVHVLDAALRPVAPGAVGELYLSGPQTARGYLNQPGLTASRFVASSRGERLYRTGDLVRWTDDGLLDYLGRADDQVKIRGFRIELGEIESVLAAHPTVGSAAVIVSSDDGPRRLVAFATGTTTADELHAHLAERLPEHMVPSAIVVLDELPRTTAGKIDRRALPVPAATGGSGRAPSTPLEEQLAALFAAALGVEEIGVDDSFFALGGDSIVSMQLVGKARAAGLAFSPRDVFEHRTVAALAAVVAGRDAAVDSTATLVTDPGTLRRLRATYPTATDVWPLTPLQQGLLFHADFDGSEIDLYTVQSELELVGPLDHDRLRDAGRALLARHENLRTAFVHDGDGAVQVVLDDVDMPFTEIDLRRAADPAAEVTRIVDADRVARFDLAAPPLLRFTLMRLPSANDGDERHRLLITNHHIVLDGWSSPIVVADLFALYGGLGEPGASPQLPEVRPFRDHLAWLSAQDAAAAREAWARALDGVEEPTRLVPDSPGAAVPEQRGIDLDPALTARLTDVARERGVTLNSIVQAAWGLVLGRLTGRDDVVFGATVSGRPASLAGSESMVGLFIDTVPVRVRLRAGEPLADLVGRLQSEQAALSDHSWLGLGAIQSVVGKGELFDTLTVFESYPVDDESLGKAEQSTGLRTVGVDGRDATHYPIVLVAMPGDRLHLGLKYVPSAAVHAEGLLDRVVKVLVSITADATVPCGRIDVLDARETAQIEARNATASGRPLRNSLWDMVAAQVAAVPDAVAVVGPDESLTYAEFDARVAALASSLVAEGVGPEVTVGVQLPRSVDLVVALCAVLRAGGVFLALQPEWPAERVEEMCRSAGVAYVVSGNHGNSHDCHSQALHGANAAYVIFTSGSTGTPKGAVIRHDAICARLDWQREMLEFGPGDAALFKAPMGFDISVNEIFLPLTTGATLVIAEPDGERDPVYLLDLIARERVSFAYLVSSMLDVMLQLGTAPSSLKHVWCGGEVLTPALFDRFRAAFPDSVMYHGYGPAEATIGVSHRFYRGDDRRESVSIGVPNPDTRVLVLDRNLRPSPVGVVGELYTGGLPLGRGYVGDPVMTASRFVADPWTPGERLYRTGDLGRWNAAGELEFVGRADHQLKIRGMRVELEEIDTVLARHPDVRQAVTVVRDNALASYVVGAPTDDMREFAARFLPEHMVPSTVTTLDAFPLTANGKVDRKALPDPSRETVESRAAQGPVEEALCTLFADALGVETVGVDDSFFALGGDSIVSMQLVARARAAGFRFTPRDVFEARTVAALASVLAGRGEDTRPADDTPTGDVPLTPIVAWLVENVPALDRFSQATMLAVPQLDRARLVAAVGALLDHHDALRSRLRNGRHEITAPGSVDPATVVRRVDAIDETVFASLVGALDPANGVVLQVAFSDDRLLLVAHHLVVDGVSWRLIGDDLAAAYRGDPLTPRGTSLRAWARGLADAAVAPAREAELGWWQRVLDVEEPLLGSRALDPAVDVVGTVAEVEVELPADVTAALLTSAPETLRTGITDLLLAGLATAVAGVRGGDSVLVSLEGHGREEQVVRGADLSGTVGWFTSVHPVRLDAGGPVGDVVARVKQHLRSVPDHGIGYGLLRHLNPRTARELAGHAGPQIGVNYLGRFDGAAPASATDWGPAPEVSGLAGDADPTHPAASALEINAATVDGPGGKPVLRAAFAYPAGLLTEDRVRAIADAWRAAMAAIVAHAADPRAAALTAADLTLVDATAADVERWSARYPGFVDVWPLSPLQSGMLVHAQLDERDAYVVQTTLDLEGDLDPERLRRALRALLQRHPALSAGFLADDGVQVIPGFADVPMTVVDVASDSELAVQEDAERARPFDMATPPLMRVLLARRPDGTHRLVLSNHHILLDGWSMPLLVADLFALYADAALPPVRSYRDHLAWLAAQDATAARTAWTDALTGIEEPTRLVAAGGAPVPPDEVVAVRGAGLSTFARDAGLTVNSVVQAAWGLVLGRVLGRDDVVFGATVSGRPPTLDGAESIVGLFIDTVPIRVTTRPAEPLVDLARRVQATQIALADHTWLGLGAIQQLAGVGELFDTLAVFESYPVDDQAVTDAQAAGGLRTTAVDGRDATHYPVALVVQPDDRIDTGGWHLAIRYRPDLLTADDAQALLDRLCTVLDAVVMDPATPTAHVDVLTPSEKELIDGRNATASGRARRNSLWDMVAEHVAATPDAVAIVAPSESLTYAEFDARVAALASSLVAEGVGPEVTVGVQLPRSVDLVVALCAVLRAGGVFVALQPEWPAERVEEMCRSAGVAYVVSGNHGYSHDCHSQALHGANAAYVIFTSGSTGTPKGAVIRHDAICARLDWQREMLGFGPGDAALFKAPMGFDISVNEIFLPLTTGATLVIAEPQGERDPEYLLDLIARERVSFAYLVSSMLDVMLQLGTAPATLKHVWCGGEVLTPALFDRFRAAFPESVMYHGYGPAEATIGVSHRFYRGDDRRESVSIGVPNPDTRVLVLDRMLQSSPVGAVGEIYTGGLPLGRGYVGDPVMTASRFVADPWTPGERLYRTGDLGRWNAAGELEFVGRADHQVKVRGMRVELEEIDTVLARHADVRQAVTVVRNGNLASYVVGSPADDMREFAARFLPEHMVPTTVTTLDAFPLTANGKVDRTALPEPEVATTAGAAPTTETEGRLAALFAELLDLPEVGVDDSFFTLGGHSLLAVKLMGRIRAELGDDLPMRTIFDAPTVAALAARIDAATAPAAPRTAIVAGERPDHVPLSSVQQRFRFEQQLGAVATVPFVFRVTGPLDVGALRAGIVDVATRHEALRTVFRDGTAQHVLEPEAVRTAVDAPVVDVDPADPDRLTALLTAAVGHHFDLDHAPPLRLTVLRETPQQHVVALVVHHVAVDEWSAPILLQEWADAYAARRDGRAPEWTPLPVQYADYALWEQARLADPYGPMDAALDHWSAALDGLPDRIDLPTARTRPDTPTGRGGSVDVEIGAATAQRLRALARDESSSDLLVLTAAVAALLSRLGAGPDVAIGTPVAGRDDAALENLVGCFVNTVVLRADLSGASTFRQVAGRVRANGLAAFEHAALPFDRLVAHLDPRRDPSRNPLFQVMVTHGVASGGQWSLAGTQVADLAGERTSAQFDLTFDFAAAPDGRLRCAVEYNADLFDPASAEALADRLVRLLEQVAADPDVAVDDLSLLADGEGRWRTSPPMLPAPTVPELVAALAVRPAAACLTAGDDRRDSHQVTADVARWARHLAGLGIGPEDVVAVMLPRGADLVTALLAVQVAGAAFVAVDPTVPADRKAVLLAGTAAVVTHSSVAADGIPEAGRRIDVDTTDVAGLPAHPVTDADRVAPLHRDHPAYLVYTSGSTGLPKGVLVGHDALARLAATHHDRLAVDDAYGIPRPMPRVMHSAEFSFDASWDPLLWMLEGCELVVADSATMRDPEALMALVERERVDAVDLTPSYVDELLGSGIWDGAAHRPSIIAVGGEPVTDRIRKRFTGGETYLVDLYGPSETTVNAYRWRLDREQSEGPVAGFGVAVLDERLRPVPAGVLGELYLSGPGLARGYRDAPGLTAARFVADPHGDPGARIYRTGDLARFGVDGRLTLHGRADDQVKIRGHRIELGEVEAVIGDHPGVARAVVVVRGDGPTRRLVAYVVPASSDAGDLEQAVRAHVMARLPGYMTPAAIVVLDALPRTRHGKVDRRALPEPEVTTVAAREPSTAREIALCALFAQVLDVDSVGVDDGFFDLGGHSLLATRLVARIRAELGEDVSVAAVFQAPTPAALAAQLSAAQPFDAVLRLRTGPGHGPAVFCLPPAIGIGWSYARLLPHLPSEVPVFALQDTGDGTASIAELADRYAATVREVRPDGPYVLLGWSLGTVLAHEVAARLGSTPLVVMIDGFPEPSDPAVEELSEADALYELLLFTGYDLTDASEDGFGPAAVRELVASRPGLLAGVSDAQIGEAAARIQRISAARYEGPSSRLGSRLVFVKAGRDATPAKAQDWQPFYDDPLTEVVVDATHADMLAPGPVAEFGPALRAAVAGILDEKDEREENR